MVFVFVWGLVVGEGEGVIWWMGEWERGTEVGSGGLDVCVYIFVSKGPTTHRTRASSSWGSSCDKNVESDRAEGGGCCCCPPFPPSEAVEEEEVLLSTASSSSSSATRRLSALRRAWFVVVVVISLLVVRWGRAIGSKEKVEAHRCECCIMLE